MRIIDWSSDVCSSDLTARGQCETRHDVATATESGSPRMRIPALALLATLSLFGACQQNAPMNKSEVVHGYVTDMNAFDQFIAGKPTPAQFKAAYPDVQLVMPGDITTRERSEEHTSELQSLMRISYAV